jgi:hypothetical protein
MEKKRFLITIDEELYKELERRAKRDKLTVLELINLILWRSAKRSLSASSRPKQAEKFLEIFSRYQPYHKSERQTYYCHKCKKRHRYNSKIGKEHLKHSDK